jgi:hypothetical protein
MNSELDVEGKDNNQKGESHVVDNCCDTGNLVAAGVGDWLYDGLFYSYPAGHRNRRGVDWGHSGATRVVEQSSCPIKDREKVVDLGPIQVTAEKTKTLPLTTIMGAIALVGGIVLLLMGSRKG